MHLSHEKQWIYGALLLTVVFFIVLMFLPLFTISDGIGTPIGAPAAHERAPGTDMSLRAFHLLFIALSVVLAAFCAAWAVGQYRRRASDRLRWRRRRVGRVRRGAGGVRRGVPAQDEESVAHGRTVTLAIVAGRRRRWPCPVCFGQSDSPIACGDWHARCCFGQSGVAHGAGREHGHLFHARRRRRRARRVCGFCVELAGGRWTFASTDRDPQEGTAQC